MLQRQSAKNRLHYVELLRNTVSCTVLYQRGSKNSQYTTKCPSQHIKPYLWLTRQQRQTVIFKKTFNSKIILLFLVSLIESAEVIVSIASLKSSCKVGCSFKCNHSCSCALNLKTNLTHNYAETLSGTLSDCNIEHSFFPPIKIYLDRGWIGSIISQTKWYICVDVRIMIMSRMKRMDLKAMIWWLLLWLHLIGWKDVPKTLPGLKSTEGKLV